MAVKPISGLWKYFRLAIHPWPVKVILVVAAIFAGLVWMNTPPPRPLFHDQLAHYDSWGRTRPYWRTDGGYPEDDGNVVFLDKTINMIVIISCPRNAGDGFTPYADTESVVFYPERLDEFKTTGIPDRILVAKRGVQIADMPLPPGAAAAVDGIWKSTRQKLSISKVLDGIMLPQGFESISPVLAENNCYE